MRTGGTFEVQAMPPHVHHLQAASVTGWKSPVPYLFGGLAAMLGLIAFALLILACSYWKLSGYPDAPEEGSEDEKPKGSASGESVFMKSILVIMPGDEKPTRLATPSATNRPEDGKREKVVVVLDGKGGESSDEVDKS